MRKRSEGEKQGPTTLWTSYLDDLLHRVRVFLQERNMSQGVLAEALGYETPWTISRILSGDIVLNEANDNHRQLTERIEAQLARPFYNSCCVDENVHAQGGEAVKVESHRQAIRGTLQEYPEGRSVLHLEVPIQDALNWSWDGARCKVRMAINALGGLGTGLDHAVQATNWGGISIKTRELRLRQARELADLALTRLDVFSTHPAFERMVQSYRGRALVALGLVDRMDVASTRPASGLTLIDEGMADLFETVLLDSPSEPSLDAFKIPTDGPLNNPVEVALRTLFYWVDRLLEHGTPNAEDWFGRTLRMRDVWPSRRFFVILQRIQGTFLKSRLVEELPDRLFMNGKEV